MKHLIKSDFIYRWEKEVTQKEFFEQVTKRLVSDGYVDENYLEAIIEREKEFPTGVCTETSCVAIPHVEADYVKKSVIVVSQLTHPIPWGNMENENEKVPVKIVFNLVLTKQEKHIEVLQQVVQLIQDDDLMNELIHAKTSTVILEKIERRLEK